MTCTLEVDEDDADEDEEPEEIVDVGMLGAVREVGDVAAAPSPLAFMVMSLGLFCELVGVSHELESERSPALLLDTCLLSLNCLRRLKSRPSHGDRRPSSELKGRSRGGSCGSGGGVLSTPPFIGKSAPVADGGKESYGLGVVSMSPSPLPPTPPPPPFAVDVALPAAASLSTWPLDSPADADGVNRGVGKLLGESCDRCIIHFNTWNQTHHNNNGSFE